MDAIIYTTNTGSTEQQGWSFRNFFRPAVHDRVGFIEHILLPIIQNH